MKAPLKNMIVFFKGLIHHLFKEDELEDGASEEVSSSNKKPVDSGSPFRRVNCFGLSNQLHKKIVQIFSEESDTSE